MKRIWFAIIALSLLMVSCISGPKGDAGTASVPVKTAEPSPTPAPTPPPPAMVSEQRFFSDGVLDQTVQYAWSPDLKLLLSESTFEATRNEPDARVVYEYSGELLTLESSYEKGNTLRLQKKYAYDEKGRKKEETQLDAKGKGTVSLRYAYDASGLLASWSVMDGAGLAMAENVYVYEKGRLVKIVMKDGSGKAEGEVVLSYDDVGREVKREYLGPQGTLRSSETKFYEGGRLAREEKRGPEGFISSSVEYQYGSGVVPEKKILKDGRGNVLGYSVFSYKNR